MTGRAEPEIADPPRPRPLRWEDSPEALYPLSYRSDHWGSWPHEYEPRDNDDVAAGVHRSDCRGCSLLARLSLAEEEVESWYQAAEQAYLEALAATRRASETETLLQLAEAILIDAIDFRDYNCRDHEQGLHGTMCQAFEEYDRVKAKGS